ncbi:MAG: MutS-related protein [Solirubrobacterales bacterium]
MKKNVLHIVRRDFEEESDKNRNYENLRCSFDDSIKNEYTLDDQTWDDLGMDRVYKKLDRAYSSLGESRLYTMLRNPLGDIEKLKQRDKVINAIKNDSDLREKLQCIYYELGYDSKNTFFEMMKSDLVVNKFKYYLYTFIGKICPIIAALLIFMYGEKYVLGILLLSSLNIFINFRERYTIKSRGIIYLRDIIRASKKIASINNEAIKDYSNEIKSSLHHVRDIDRNTILIGFVNMWAGLFEFISIIFLIEECSYYEVSSVLKEKRQYILNIYDKVGELEALISIAGYQHNLRQSYVNPRFLNEAALNIVDGIHPLVSNPVPNSVNIKEKGIVLTGTNMSGKSTFLRMLGINMLLAQTFYFVLAKYYEAGIFNIVSSISPNDDLTKGKSYYMAEAESILRIVKAMENERPVFCPIDEIFRGTNPVERIAMSTEILAYLNNEKSISIVATHDREIADILKDTYEFYYFSEKVDDKTGLSFDYKLKPGVSQTRNAIKLLEYIGYPKEITEKSYRRAETIEGFI